MLCTTQSRFCQRDAIGLHLLYLVLNHYDSATYTLIEPRSRDLTERQYPRLSVVYDLVTESAGGTPPVSMAFGVQ